MVWNAVGRIRACLSGSESTENCEEDLEVLRLLGFHGEPLAISECTLNF